MRHLATAAVLFALCFGLADAAPPPPPPGTTVVVPAHWLRSADVDVNAWFASKGGTVLSRQRGKIRWKITLAETLDAGQQAALKTQIEAKFNSVTFE